jgi:deoxyribonuclease-4
VRLGAHVGVTGGLDKAPALGKSIGCEVIQIFAKSPYMWKGTPLTDATAAGFRAAVKSEALRSTAVHHGYLLNLGNPKPENRAQSQTAFLDELDRAERLGADALIFHPGAHMGSGVAAGLDELVKGLDAAFAATQGYRVRALLENSAGQGTTLCSKFDELAEVLRRLEHPERAGVALDTCHLFAAGHDFRTPEGYQTLVEGIEGSFGVAAVRAFHLNDAKAEAGSNKDRHENIGKGKIGTEGFAHLLGDRRWAEVPGYLETPLADDDYQAYVRDLATLRGLTDPGPRKVAKAKAPARRPRTPK